jgi:hypothetical protein
MSTSLFTHESHKIRPAGVRILGWAIVVIGAFLIGDGLLVYFGKVSFATGSYFLGGLETMGPLIFWIVGCALVALGFSLLRGFRWSRRLGIVAAALLLSTAVMPVSGAVIYGNILGIITNGAKIIVAIAIIRYLLQPEVADYFSA